MTLKTKTKEHIHPNLCGTCGRRAVREELCEWTSRRRRLLFPSSFHSGAPSLSTLCISWFCFSSPAASSRLWVIDEGEPVKLCLRPETVSFYVTKASVGASPPDLPLPASPRLHLLHSLALSSSVLQHFVHSSVSTPGTSFVIGHMDFSLFLRRLYLSWRQETASCLCLVAPHQYLLNECCWGHE